MKMVTGAAHTLAITKQEFDSERTRDSARILTICITCLSTTRQERWSLICGLRTRLDADTVSKAQRSTSNGFSSEMQPSQPMQPTPDPRTAPRHLMKTRLLQATPALASGG